MKADQTRRICGAPTEGGDGPPCRRTPPPGKRHCYLHRETDAERSAIMDAVYSCEPGDFLAGAIGVVCGIYIAHDPAAYEAIAELLLPILAGGSLANRAAKTKNKRKGKSKSEGVARSLPEWRSIRYLDAFVVGIVVAYGTVLAVHGDVPLLRALHELGLIP